ncbi:Pentatricopeptide repeat-containing protein [Seminavis robusta]|uniref:Pentatricopeptide repeat-containing protein n=1 Tax=Seminavis robusta TaxID=568900 RepID=A0A9N8HAQ9_9STRA|nr:Pentatricopeptide repeat-containing protein [Seminavis robusta]|eukprot:Sro250_g098990.1 Pentatricopeptide repeat-containing protein (620) ;mRNA; r:29000-30859
MFRLMRPLPLPRKERLNGLISEYRRRQRYPPPSVVSRNASIFVGRDHDGVVAPQQWSSTALGRWNNTAKGSLGWRSTAEFSTQLGKQDTLESEKSDASKSTNNDKFTKLIERLKSDDPQALEDAHQLWTEISINYQEQEGVLLDLAEAILDRLQKVGMGERTQIMAETIVNDLERLSQEDPSIQPPSVACYQTLVSLWSQEPPAGNPEQAERSFWKLISGWKIQEPTTKEAKSQQTTLTNSLNTVLRCWAISGKPDSGMQVNRILAKVTQAPKKAANPVTIIQPNPETCHLVNLAWQTAVVSANSDNTLQSKDYLYAAKRVHGNVDFMWRRAQRHNHDPARTSINEEWLPQPSVYSWLIEMYAQAGAYDKAKALLDRLIAPHRSSNEATTIYRQHLPLPTTSMYNHVLAAMSHQGKGFEAGLVLSKWVSQCQQKTLNLEEPETTSSSVETSLPSDTAAWCQPDETSCLLVIHAWGCVPEYRRAKSAENILQRMLELERQDNPRLKVLPSPTVETYNAVLQAWSISRHYKLSTPITQVERLLVDMNKYRRYIKENPCAPNMRSYELLLETYARFGYKLGDRKRRMDKVIREIKGHRKLIPSERCLELVELCQDDTWKLEG